MRALKMARSECSFVGLCVRFRAGLQFRLVYGDGRQCGSSDESCCCSAVQLGSFVGLDRSPDSGVATQGEGSPLWIVKRSYDILRCLFTRDAQAGRCRKNDVDFCRRYFSGRDWAKEISERPGGVDSTGSSALNESLQLVSGHFG